MNLRRLNLALHLDGVANIAGGVVLLAVSGWLAPHLGLNAGWPLRLAGALLVVYGIDNHLVARRPSRAKLTGLGAVDVGFAAAVLVAAITDPSAAETWVRWALAAIGAASLTFGVVKLVGRAMVSVPRTDRHTPASSELPG